MLLKNGTLFCDDGQLRKADLRTEAGTIAGIGTIDAAGDTLDAEGCYVVPGFVDIHIHGAMGADFSDGTAEAIDTMACYLLTQGVTSFLGTSMALPESQLSKVYSAARERIGAELPGQAVIRGINMEGPFFNMEKRGAQNPEYIIPANFEMFQRLNDLSGGNIRTVAVAPEVEGGLDFVRRASAVSNVSLAHSCSTYDIAHQALELGANHITHVFNGMPPFHHRDPGIVGAAADSDAYVELICDGVHVHPAVVRAVFQLFGDDRMCLISDAMRACGMSEGKYDLGGQVVTVKNGAATIESGSLAGSITVLSECFRRAVKFGIPLESALKAATINPARSVGLDGVVGSLVCGKRADIVVLDKELNIKHIILGGQLVV